MKPFRKYVVLTVDGGGLRGIIPAIALSTVEERMGKTLARYPLLRGGHIHRLHHNCGAFIRLARPGDYRAIFAARQSDIPQILAQPAIGQISDRLPIEQSETSGSIGKISGR
jgi:hypothetical protein